MPCPPNSLAAESVLVWHLKTETVRAPGRLAELEKLLSPAERERMGRYVHEEDRRNHLLARATLRTLLSRYAAVRPEAWRFSEGPRSRPEIVPADESHGLRFSISHTHGMIAVALAMHHDIGVDVESTERAAPLNLASRYFSPAEAADLETLDEASRDSRFFEYWTLKEAYAKARGLGLSIPLSETTFTLSKGGPPTVSFAAGDLTATLPWRFTTLRPDQDHVLSAAVYSPDSQGEAAPTFIIRDMGPFETWASHPH